ncbi:RNA polymerase sigma-70 factor (ECF subfamily) [Nakamurella sp. UYEF19]|uniref:RNA polymerase sigma factor n=1 Tax=Nakamurella sp. UYEF19 TaxID=1756392 RepID=UPI003395B95E
MADRAWFDELYRSSRDRLLMIALAFTRDLPEAQDVVHEAFVRGWAARDKLARLDKPEAWLCTVALNVARRRARRRAMRRPFAGAADPLEGESGLDTADLIDLHRAVDSLPADQRTVVVLHHLADLPLEEVAAALHVPVGTVKSRLSRGRAQLRLDLDLPSDQFATVTEEGLT